VRRGNGDRAAFIVSRQSLLKLLTDIRIRDVTPAAIGPEYEWEIIRRASKQAAIMINVAWSSKVPA
jgi:hypothetical protein